MQDVKQSTQSGPGIAANRQPYGHDKLPEMEVIVKAKELERHTLILTSNEKRYPKKYRITFVNRLQGEALDITDALMEANDLSLSDPEEKAMRFRCQRAAMRYCRMLLHHIETSHDLGILDDATFAHWAQMAGDVKNKAAAWHLSDKKRAEKYDKRP